MIVEESQSSPVKETSSRMTTEDSGEKEGQRLRQQRKI